MTVILVFKTIIIYFVILLIMKFMGKREIGQLSLFDFVVLLLIADVAVISLSEEDKFLTYIIPTFFLALIQKVLAFILLKFPSARSFFDGKEAIIIYEGKLNIKEMRKQNYSVDDLLPQLRLKNIKSLSEVRFMILEPNGEVSIFKYNDNNEEMTKAKMGLNDAVSSSKASIANATSLDDIAIFPLIVSGCLKKENLNLLKLKEECLKK